LYSRDPRDGKCKSLRTDVPALAKNVLDDVASSPRDAPKTASEAASGAPSPRVAGGAISVGSLGKPVAPRTARLGGGSLGMDFSDDRPTLRT